MEETSPLVRRMVDRLNVLLDFGKATNHQPTLQQLCEWALRYPEHDQALLHVTMCWHGFNTHAELDAELEKAFEEDLTPGVG